MPDVATYALTRGYKGIQKVRYSFIIRRNRALRKCVPERLEVDHIVFHEGNISEFDQFVIRLFSGLSIVFRDISTTFKPDDDQHYQGLSRRDLGYALMCRFHYRDVWPLIAHYDVVYRIDEDCLISSFPKIEDRELFVTGIVTNETHDITNETLPAFLKSLGLSEFYDHEFPYTNFFVTRPVIWTEPNVREVLQAIGGHPNALMWRWGDLPVLGIILKAFYNWSPISKSSQQIRYKHLSHNTDIQGGKSSAMRRSPIVEIQRRARRFFLRFRRISD